MNRAAEAVYTAIRRDGHQRAVLDTMQTMPAFVYLIPVLLLFDPGRVPAVIAAFIYALPVGMRLTNHGMARPGSTSTSHGPTTAAAAAPSARYVKRRDTLALYERR